MKPTVETYALAGIGATKGVWEYYIKPELTGRRAWTALGIGIIGYELVAPEGQLMSDSADRLIDKYPIAARLGGLLVAGVITSHVFNLVDERYDLMHHGLNFIKGVGNGHA